MALTPFTSKLIADTGILMGDEGKGRLIPEVVQELRQGAGQESPVAIVMKVNGGANSGHTAGGLKLNLIPAGVIERDVPILGIGAGVVADPRKFWWEIQGLDHSGYDILPRLLIDERAQVSDLTHRLLDLSWENYRVNVLEETARGATGRGISPAYCDETSQFQIYYGDFKGISRATYDRKMRQRIDRAMRTIRHVCRVSETDWNAFFEKLSEAEIRANKPNIEAGLFPEEEFDFTRFMGTAPFTLNEDRVLDAWWDAGSRLAENIRDLREAVLAALAEDRYVIGEFGQSYWLDKRHGFPPNVTASHTYTPEFFQSAGIPIQPAHTIGVCKAYDTKVGTHVFLTEMPEAHPLTEKLKKLEFGTSTGRQRMVGWFDAVEKGDALRYGGFQDLVINKLDALTWTDDWQGGELLICTGYRDPEGNHISHVPRVDALRQKMQPVYLQLAGWGEDISQVRQFADLPQNAIIYVATCVKAIFDVAYRGQEWPKTLPNLRYIGVGPDPAQIIRDVPETRELLQYAR